MHPIKIAISGTFDVENYGDLMFPLIAEYEIGRRVESLQVTRYSYREKIAGSWPYDVTPLGRLESDLESYDGLLIGGGHLIRFDKTVAEGYFPIDEKIQHPTGYWLAPALAAHTAQVPVLWNAPSATNDTPPWGRSLVKVALDLSSYVSVRDASSANELRNIGYQGECSIIPDTVFGIPGLLPLDEAELRSRPLLGQAGVTHPYIVVQANADLATIAQKLASHPGMKDYQILVVPIGPILGDHPTLIRETVPEAKTLEVWPTPLDLAALIATSAGCVAVSLHLTITALSYGLPVLRTSNFRGGKYAFAEDSENISFYDEELSTIPEIFFQNLGARRICSLAFQAQSKLDAHWHRIVEILKLKSNGKREAKQYFQAWNEMIAMAELVNSSEHDLAAEFQNNDARKIADLEASARASEEAMRNEIAEAGEALSERQRKIEQLSATLEEREQTIRQLNQAKARGDEKITALSQSLRQQLQTQQQSHLHEILRIQADERALRDEITATFRHSTSWRVTAPLRATARTVRRFLRPREQAQGSREPMLGTAEANPASVAQAGATPKAAMRALLKTRLDVFLAARGKLKLPSHPRPDVTIVLVLYNQAEFTFGCLSSIAEAAGASEVSIEVVIVDNGSTDATLDLLARVEGAKIIRNTENLHFLRGVNRAAQDAVGRHILLLNNDALLVAGSLEAAVRTIDADLAIGAVGGRIVLPDGTLQEAGSIVWSDGTCVGYGRGDRPDAPEYMFRRDVDYCSGAFLLTPRAQFEELNGLDERYAPAYYEETDYCLRIWQSGHRVVFDPDVIILHYEFGSASTSDQALALQQRNLKTFRERHAGWLRNQLSFTPQNILSARSVPSGAKRVLMIEDRVPHVRLGSGYPRANDLLRAFVTAGAEMTLFPMFKHIESPQDIQRSVPLSVEVMADRSASDLRRFLEERRGYYDAILVCRPHNMREFISIVGDDKHLIGQARVLYDAEAIFAARELVQRELSGEKPSAAEANRLLAQEIGLTGAADAIISVSEQEKKLFEEQGAGPVYILGHQIEVSPTEASFEDRADMLFVGAIHGDDSPNADSLRWFAQEILPLVAQELGADIRLKVVGVNRASSVSALDGKGLELIGPVDQLRPWFDRARIMVAPTRIAAGIPHKVHQAAAFGVPTVTTDLLALQMGWRPGTDTLSATAAIDFAAACVKLYRDRQLWELVRKSALERVATDCSIERFQHTVNDLLALVGDGSARSRRREGLERGVQKGKKHVRVAVDADIDTSHVPS
jgi:GT2 family glycosyltransferase